MSASASNRWGEGATSALGALFPRETVAAVALLAGITGGTGTSANPAGCLVGNTVHLGAQSTSGGGLVADKAACAPVVPQASTAEAIATLRRRLGLTWDQLARAFGVSRRSVHLWASGKPLSAPHEEHLRRALALVTHGSAPADVVRGALLTVVQGEQVLDLLAARRFAEVEAALSCHLETGPVAEPRTRKQLSDAAQLARRPLPPELLAAEGEPAGYEVRGPGRRVQTTRSGGRDGA